ncbi:MAG: 2-C-methyl-D-erythritol 2,4-cyclodiphosphate synthase, partial [Eubacteriales bacterium]
DVLLHALIDALLGAAGERDIGFQFPPSDEQYKDIDSRFLLEKTVRILEKKFLTVEYADMTIVAQKPKLSPYIEAMRTSIAETLGVARERVNVKATTEENMGFTGRGEGIAAHAVCLLSE